jgi:RES domain-containing protein
MSTRCGAACEDQPRQRPRARPAHPRDAPQAPRAARTRRQRRGSRRSGRDRGRDQRPPEGRARRDPGARPPRTGLRRRAHDLRLYGQSHINAAFAYTRPTGNRFNAGDRGAWYCAWHVLTSAAEVGFHRTRELAYIGRFEDEARYVELLADFIGDFPDLRGQAHPALDPDPGVGYPAGQTLAAELRGEGHRGLIYPSVRHPGGRCFVAFDPGIIQNVRPGASWTLAWRGTPDFSVKAAAAPA